MAAPEDAMKLLSNGKNRAIVTILAGGPSYPRALAAAVGLSEDDVQRKLHRLESAGIVEGAWAYHGKTVKEYALRASGLSVDFAAEGVAVRITERE